MMGRTHALTGAAAFLGGAAGWGLWQDPVSPHTLVLGTAVATGAAVLPDIDHPGSGISRTFGPLTQGFAWTVGKLSGGHRNGTHSYLGAALFNLFAWTALAVHGADGIHLLVGVGTSMMLAAIGLVRGCCDSGKGRGKPSYKKRWHGPAATGTCVAAAAALFVSAVIYGPIVGTVAVALLLIVVLAAAIRVWKIKGWVDDAMPIPITLYLLWQDVNLDIVPAAVVLGVLVHIAGDQVTKGGCPTGWPWSQTNFGPQLFKTNSRLENGPVTIACWVAALAGAAWNIAVIT